MPGRSIQRSTAGAPRAPSHGEGHRGRPAEGDRVLQHRHRQRSRERAGLCRAGRGLHRAVGFLRAPAGGHAESEAGSRNRAATGRFARRRARGARVHPSRLRLGRPRRREGALARARAQSDAGVRALELRGVPDQPGAARRGRPRDPPSRGSRSAVDSHQRVRHAVPAVLATLRRSDRARAARAWSSNPTPRSPWRFRALPTPSKGASPRPSRTSSERRSSTTARRSSALQAHVLAVAGRKEEARALLRFSSKR